MHKLARKERLAPHCCRWCHSVCLASSKMSALGRLLPTSTARVNCLLPTAYCRLLHAAYLGTFRSSRCLVEAQPTWKARPTLVACPDLALHALISLHAIISLHLATPLTLLHHLPGAPDPYRLVEGADGTTARLLTEELRSRAEALVGKVSRGRSAWALLILLGGRFEPPSKRSDNLYYSLRCTSLTSLALASNSCLARRPTMRRPTVVRK